jgi:hypothetical protein
MLKLAITAIAIAGNTPILRSMNNARNLSLAVVIAALLPNFLSASDTDGDTTDPLFQMAETLDLNDFVWKKRPIVVFADSENDPAFIEQLELLHAQEDQLRERDVVVLTDTDPDALSPLRKKLRPRGFMLVIISKEGRVQLRKPFPWDVRELTRSIDKLPIRQREIRDAKTGG